MILDSVKLLIIVFSIIYGSNSINQTSKIEIQNAILQIGNDVGLSSQDIETYSLRMYQKTLSDLSTEESKILI